MNNLNIDIWPALEKYLSKYDINEFYYVTDRLENRCTVFQRCDVDFEIAFRENHAGKHEDHRVQVIVTFRDQLYKFFDEYLIKERKERLEQDNILFSLKDTTGHKILFTNSRIETFADADDLDDIFKWLTDTGKWFYDIIVNEIKLYNNKIKLHDNGHTLSKIKSRPKPPMIMEDAPKLTYKQDENEKELVMRNAGYKCEIATLIIEHYKEKHNGVISEDKKKEKYKSHPTFRKEKSGYPYLEVHHLIPFHLQEEFDVSIDIHENMICLCPTCHRMLHFMEMEERKQYLSFIYKKKKLGKTLESCGIKGITLEKFLELACK